MTFFGSHAERIQARTLVSEHRNRVLSLPGVVGVGLGRRIRGGLQHQEATATVFVERKRPLSELSADEVLPAKLISSTGTEIGTDVVELGTVTAPPPPLAEDFAPTGSAQALPPFIAQLRIRRRPALGGLSAANALFPIGTLSVGLRSPQAPLQTYALSCNHVFGLMGGAVPGQPILQPAPLDGGMVGSSTFGWFSHSAPLDFNQPAPQVADASVVLCQGDLLTGIVAGSVSPVRFITDQAVVEPGWAVRKVGRTTGLTYGRVLGVDGTLKVDYSSLGFPDKVVYYDKQIVTTGMGAYGDSGSLLCTLDGWAIGMLFSGSTVGTVHNPIVDVLDLLGFAPATAAAIHQCQIRMT